MGPLKVGTTLSQKYKIDRLLAESGGVILYEATDTARAQRVWIKILQRDAMNNATTLARFQREAAGSKVLDVGKSDGLPYMVATELGTDKPRVPAPHPRAAGGDASTRTKPLPFTRPTGAASKAAPMSAGKTTLPGVAPPHATPPPPVRVVGAETESGIPMLDDDLLVSDSIPPPAVAAKAEAKPALEAKAPEAKTPAKASEAKPPPKATETAKPEAKVIVAPLVAPLIIEIEPPKSADEAAAAAEPAVAKAQAQVEPVTPKKADAARMRKTIMIEGRQPKEKTPTSTWVAALVAVACLTGLGGWYLGRKDTRAATPPPPAQTAIGTPTETAATPSETAATTTTATAEPTATASSSESTASIASSEPTATATTAKPATPPTPPPHVHVIKPKKPPAGGDPLTL